MSIELDLKSVVSPALLKRGCINVIGLETVRQQTGARWEKMRDSIYARLESLLSHKLGPSDFFIRLGEAAYLVATPSSDGDDSRLTCLKIAYELHCSLLGACSVGDISLSRVTADRANQLELCAIDRPEIVELAIRGGVEDLYRDIAEAAASHSPLLATTHVVPVEAPPVFQFSPVWDAPNQAVTAYRLETENRLPAMRSSTAIDRSVFRNDLKVFLGGLAHATRMLTIGLRAGGRYLMIIPISRDVLGVPSGRMEIAGAMRNLSSELRPFMVFEIADLPLGVPQSRMSDPVCAIRPFCRAVTIDLALGQIDHVNYANVGHQGFSIALSSPIAPPGIHDEIAKLGGMTRRQGLRSMVTGIQTLDLARAACRAGINHIGGAFVGPDVEVPQPMRRLSWDEMLNRKVS